MLTKTNDRLKQIARDIRGLVEHRAELAEDIRALYEEAKNEGFTVRALKQAIKIHSMDADQRAKYDADQGDIEVYLANLEGREIQ